MTQERQAHDKRGGLADCLHWGSTCLSIYHPFFPLPYPTGLYTIKR